MSYENVPKNYPEQAVLTRQGAPEYSTLSIDAAPVPTADPKEVGAIWEHSDTGDRFRWTGSVWIQVATKGSIKVDTTPQLDFLTEVAKGKIEGHEVVDIRGINYELGNNATEHLWDVGGLLSFPTAGEQLEIVSTSANDTDGGTGANTVLFSYLDDTFTRQQMILTLNGTTPVLLPVSNVYRSFVLITLTAGSTNTNQGDIEVRQSGGGLARIGMHVNTNRSHHGFYTIPAGFNAYILYAHSTIGKAKDIDIDITVTRGDSPIFLSDVFSDLYQNAVTYAPNAPVGTLIEKSDIAFLCTSSSPSVKGSGFTQLLLVANDI